MCIKKPHPQLLTDRIFFLIEIFYKKGRINEEPLPGNFRSGFMLLLSAQKDGRPQAPC